MRKGFALWFVLFYLFVGYQLMDYDNPTYQFIYFTWDKAKDLIFALTVMYLLDKQEDKRTRLNYGILAVFLGSRVVWEIIVIACHIPPNDRKGIFYLYLIVFLAVCIITFYPKKK